MRFLLALLAGGLAPLSFSPVNFWPAGILSILGLLILLQETKPKQAAFTGWAYGLGFFGVGVSWVYVSINVYGNASPLLAGFISLVFISGLALLFTLQCWGLRKFFLHGNLLLSFPAIWVLFEWFRGWFLTGFPWLYLGYAHIETGLASLAPIFGVLGISFVVALAGCIVFQLVWLLVKTKKFIGIKQGLLTASVLFLWIFPWLLSNINWVEEVPDRAVEIGLVQANIDQNSKFDRNYLQQVLDLYSELSSPLWSTDIIFWPETAIPMLYQQASVELDFFGRQAVASNSTLVTGILYRGNDDIHNSIVSLGNGKGIYHKQKLVPFGEYVPLQSLLQGLLEIFDLPMSSLGPGPDNQDLLTASGLSLAPYICYEVVYPDFVRKSARDADFLITISNDTWFGSSWGPLQHLQMAAMRALENGRYMVRTTNNGVSAIIDEHGHILDRTEQFQTEVLTGEVKVFTDNTPFTLWGSYPILLLSSLLLIFSFLKTRKKAE